MWLHWERDIIVTSRLNLGKMNMFMLTWWLRWWRTCLQRRRPGFDPWVGKIPWRREWLPTLVFLPREFHGQRSLVGYSPRGHRVGHNWSDLACRSLSPTPSCKPPSSQKDMRNLWGFPGGSGGKESACNTGDPGSIPWLWRSHGEGNGNPL